MHLHLRTVLFVSAFAFCALDLFAAPPAPPAPDDAGLPIRRVVLYKHGLGYFERQGDVNGEATVRLRFKQEQMGDVLKTLTVLDRSGGSVDAIAYDSQKPAEMVLSEFAFDLRADDVQIAILQQLRGARVSADFAGIGQITGSVLGLDNRTEKTATGVSNTPRLSLLTDEGKIVGADLFDLRALKFEDPALAAEVSRYLGVLRSTHHRDEKALELKCRGEGDRTVFASYAVEQPVWKATYRLVLFSDQSKPFLQGWAVVDNTSEDDWTDVSLSLIAGLPVSFRFDLYTPEYRQRPLLEVNEIAFAGAPGLAPAPAEAPVAGGGGGGATKKFRGGAKPGADAGEARLESAGVAEAAKSLEEAYNDADAQSVTREIGDLLEYRIDHPVSIPRNRSALLPIVTGTCEGGRVALYRESLRAHNPMSAIRLKNTTGVTLEGGPLTVLEGDTYAGESLIDTLKPDEQRYVPFAVELGVRATTKFETRSDKVRRVQILNGGMIWHFDQVEQKTYSFENKNDAPRTVIVEHPKRPNFTLRQPASASEQELELYRFEVALGPKESKALTVIESQPSYGGFTIGNIDADTLVEFQQQGRLNADAEKFLREVLEKKGAIAAIQAAIAAREQEMAEIANDQARVRKNLDALGGSAEEKDLRRSYVENLKQQEERVKALRAEIDAAKADMAKKTEELNARIASFTLEYTLGG